MIAILLLIAAPVLTAAPAIAVGPPPIDPPAAAGWPGRFALSHRTVRDLRHRAGCGVAAGARHGARTCARRGFVPAVRERAVAVIGTGVARQRLPGTIWCRAKRELCCPW